MYAKLIEGRLVPAPAMIRTEQGDVYNPDAEVLAAAGFKPVVEALYPEVDEESPICYVPKYTEDEAAITMSWEAVTPAEADSEN